MKQRIEKLPNTVNMPLKTVEQKMELNITCWSDTEALSFEILD